VAKINQKIGKIIQKSKHHGKYAREKQMMMVKKIDTEKIANRKIVNDDDYNNKTTKHTQ